MLCPGGDETRKIPLNVASNGRELSEICSIFERARSEHCQLTAPIEISFFGTAWHPGLHLGTPPFPSRLGPTQVNKGLALIYANYEQMKIVQDILKFRMGGKASIASSPCELIGLIALSFLGMHAAPGLAPGCTPFPLYLGPCR